MNAFGAARRTGLTLACAVLAACAGGEPAAAPPAEKLTLGEAVERYERLFGCKIFFSFDTRLKPSAARRYAPPAAKDRQAWLEYFNDFLVLSKPIAVEGYNDVILSSQAAFVEGTHMNLKGVTVAWPWYEVHLKLPLLRLEDLERVPEALRVEAVCRTRSFTCQVGEAAATCPKRLYKELRGGCWVAAPQNARWGFLDEDGRWVVEPVYQEARAFYDGRAAVRVGRAWGFVDESGKVRVPAQLEEVRDFREERAAFRRGGLWGFVDRDGRIRIEPRFEEVRDFSEALAAVRRGDRWGFVDREGRVVIPIEFEHAESFREQRAGAVLEARYGYLDPKGEWAVWRRFDWGLPFERGRALVLKDREWDVIDRSGLYVNWPEYMGLRDHDRD
ncbi:MAG: WG repeat-containing protein [Planctomycetes bacterium]|nr:WG repeat-containing protein [Planctomycetota bacterium]